MWQNKKFDVLIIGAGVSGCAVARELSKKKLSIAVLDKASDVCEGTSKANSGIVHAGFDAMPRTLKAALNVRGSRMMEQLSRELDFPYKKNGALVLCFDASDIEKLEELKNRGLENGVENLQILTKEQVLAREPGINGNVQAALYAPDSAIVCPFGLNLALAENAAVNGAEFFLQTEVIHVIRKEEAFKVVTTKGDFYAETVINAAGVYADEIHNMVCQEEDRITIHARRGEYLLYDKSAGNQVMHTLFQLPTALGKSVLVTPTVHGNLLTGPTAGETEDKESVITTEEGLTQILEKAGISMEKVPSGEVITSFAGLRAHEEGGDFVIGPLKGVPGFFDVAGIESPGLTCAPAIGEAVAEMVNEYLGAGENKGFLGSRRDIPHMAELSEEEKQRMIAKDSSFAQIICRCEMITEGEILAAIHRPLGATTVDGVKRRTRAGMGRCQAGFCLPKVVEILARELELPKEQVTKNGGDLGYLLSPEGGLCK